MLEPYKLTTIIYNIIYLFIYILAYCNKTFYKKNNLRRHMLIHNNIKPYTCLYCDRKFSQKSTRDIHSLNHTGMLL